MLFSSWFKMFNNTLKKKVDGTGLFLFRIVFSCIVLVEVTQMKVYQHLMFDKIPYAEPSDVNFNVLLIFWQLTLVCLIIGFKTRGAVVINFIMSSFFFMTLSEFEYNVFYTYQSISFLFLFLPISRGLSVDFLLRKIKYSGPYQTYTPPTAVNVWSYYLPILLGLGFVYFDSVCFKLTSNHIWLKGLGVWLPASLPQAVHVNFSWLLNQEYVVKFLGYLTMIFEIVFLFFFWFNRYRTPFIIIGVGLHVGILGVFPTPLFAITAISFYVLLVPVHYWRKLFQKRKEKIKFYYDQECPLCVRTKIILGSITPNDKVGFYGIQTFVHQEPLLKDINLDLLFQDIHGVKDNKVYQGFEVYQIIFLSTWYLFPIGLFMSLPGVNFICRKIYELIAKNRLTERCTEDTCGYKPPTLPVNVNNIKLLKNVNIGAVKSKLLIGLIVTCFFFQGLSTWFTPLFQNQIKQSPIALIQRVNNTIYQVKSIFDPISYKTMAITNHPLFLEGHFKNYTSYYGLKNQEGEFLPVYNKNGLVESDNYGTNWRFFTFEVNGPNPKINKAISGYKRYLYFYVGKNKIKHKDLRFDLMKKKVKVPRRWGKDFLNKMILNPWVKVGTMGWSNGEFFVKLDSE
ncbi:MAG: putative DCC family thiol-disulfide oxidoreductase YuxK [bacterium]|jgi:predicted DCC family thiol-disulfide oxidoreductase YuxK